MLGMLLLLPHPRTPTSHHVGDLFSFKYMNMYSTLFHELATPWFILLDLNSCTPTHTCIRNFRIVFRFWFFSLFFLLFGILLDLVAYRSARVYFRVPRSWVTGRSFISGFPGGDINTWSPAHAIVSWLGPRVHTTCSGYHLWGGRGFMLGGPDELIHTHAPISRPPHCTCSPSQKGVI